MQPVWDAIREDFSGWTDLSEATHVVLRLLVALVLGGVLGWQRESEGKPAGLRTHMLVCMGAALFMVIANRGGLTEASQSRVIQGLVTGIGFLGGGAILKLSQEREVRGLTTAANIWLATGVGIARRMGQPC